MTEQRPSKEKVCVLCREPWRLGHRCNPTPLPSELSAMRGAAMDNPTAQMDGLDMDLAHAAEEIAKLRTPLTDTEIDAIANDGHRNAAGGIYATSVYAFARAIEAAHGADPCDCRETWPQLQPGRLNHGNGCPGYRPSHEPPTRERVGELLSRCIFHAETGNDESAAFYGDLAAVLRAAQPPTGICSAHQYGEDPSCRLCYPAQPPGDGER